MRCLLLLLTLLWVVHSFKQIILDYQKCLTKEYFCLVEPQVAMQTKEDKLLIPFRPTASTREIKTSPSGVLIKPLTPHKWLVILHAEISDMDTESGLYLKIMGLGKTQFPVIAGCNRYGAVDQDTQIALKLTFDVMWTSSAYIEKKKILCTGILKSITSETIAATLKALLQQEEFVGLSTMVLVFDGLLYELKERWRLIKDESPADTSAPVKGFDFVEVSVEKQCDFNLLKPSDGPLTYTHKLTEIEMYSEPIDCKTSRLDKLKEGADRTNFDLLLKLEGDDIVFEGNKITCDPIGSSYELNFYTKDGTKKRIDGEAIVACGERSKCSDVLPAVCKAPECEPPTKVEESCDSTKEKCEELKCPNDHWYINDKKEMKNGTVICRKESIEDESSPRWFAKDENNKFVRLDKASCLKLYECQEKNPIVSTCDGFNHTETCAKASFNSTTVYCPINFDMKYMEQNDGNETATDHFICDKKIGKWKLKGANNEVKIANVYCLFNKDRDNILLGGKAFLKDDEKPENDFWGYYKNNWEILFTVLLLPIPLLIYLAIKKVIKSRKQKKIDAFLEKVYKKKNERFQESWTTEEKWAVRPFNSHNYRGGTETLLPDLSMLDGRACCKIMWKEWSLYSPEEKHIFLENCIPMFSTSERVACFVMPLLYKCTEHNEAWNNLKQMMHPKLVYCAFKILKLFVNIYSKRGDQDSADRIRKVIGIRANNMLFPMGLERASDECKDTTKIRIHGLEAALFAGNEEVETRLLTLWQDKGWDISNPLRKFAWAIAVKRDAQLGPMVQRWNEETVKFHANWGKPKDPVEEQWGDTLEHLFYAICAEPEERTLMERVFFQVIHKKLFTPRHIWSGFQSTMEVFDYNQPTGRIMFREQHRFITEKMSYVGMYFKEIFRLIYTYSAFYPGHQGWLLPYCAKTFPEDAAKFLLPKALTYVEIYNGAYKFKTVAQVVEEELSKVDFEKPDAVEEEKKFMAQLKGRKKFRKKVKPGWSQRSWVDKKWRKKKPKKEGEEESKNSKTSKKTKGSKNQKDSRKPSESMKSQGPGGLVDREDDMGDAGNEERKKPPSAKETPMLLEGEDENKNEEKKKPPSAKETPMLLDKSEGKNKSDEKKPPDAKESSIQV